MKITEFDEKLNKIDGNIYVIEEKVALKNGVYESDLQHDNINVATFSVYTGSKLTGEKIDTYTLSTPSLTPWKKIVRVFADVSEVYLSYETDGDTVEAEDINRIQDAVVETQEKLTQEEERAAKEEKQIADNLAEEIKRAQAEERRIDDQLGEETRRAESAEVVLQNNLNQEIVRAKSAEKVLADNLDQEARRAQQEEIRLDEKLDDETRRAKAAESTLQDNLDKETIRAKSAEKSNTDAVATEVTRAKKRETELQEDIQTESSRATAAEEAIRNDISSNKPKWDDKYTKNEVDNKFSALENKIDWKEAVDTYADLLTTYPAPEDGWTVNVKDTDYTYRWSGTAWVAISANAIPKATQGLDGLLSKEDKQCYDDAYSKRHTHSNKTTLDKLTETLLANWTDAYSKRHEHGNKGILDGITQTLLDCWNAAYTHIGSKLNPHGVTKSQVGLGNVPNVTTNNQIPTFTQSETLENIASGATLTSNLGKIAKAISDLISHLANTTLHITSAERTNWNDANSKKHTHSNKSIVDKLTQAMLDKVDGIAAGAEVNVQGDWSEVDTASDSYIKNKPSSMPASDVSAWAKASAKPVYGWSEIGSKPSTFPPASHSHAKSQITDMPTKLSQFSNDTGYITSSDVDTSHNHTHANKSVLDTITQAMLDKLEGIAAGANKYIHPAYTARAAGLYKVTVDSSGHVSAVTAVTKADVTALGIPAQDTNTTYGSMTAATSSAAGVTGLVPAPGAGKQASFLRGDGTWQTPSNTKNTAGSTNTSSKLFLIGATSQASSPTTYSHDTAYVGTDGCLYSDGKKTSTTDHNHDSSYLKKGALTWDDLKGV